MRCEMRVARSRPGPGLFQECGAPASLREKYHPIEHMWYEVEVCETHAVEYDTRPLAPTPDGPGGENPI